MALKITPTMQNPLSLGNIYKHCPLYTLYITPLKINFLTSFPIVFFFFLTFSSHPNPKRNQIRPFSTPGNFWKKNTFIFWMEILACQWARAKNSVRWPGGSCGNKSSEHYRKKNPQVTWFLLQWLMPS